MSGVSSVDVVIPWSGNCVYRASARSYVESRWRSLGFNVLIGEMDGPWSKAVAVANALEHSRAEVLVVTDGDVWTDAAPTHARAIADGEMPWSTPFGSVNRLNEPATEVVLTGGPLEGRLLKPPYKAVPGGGIVVLRRDIYDQIPLDPRFVGWGHEDEAWGMALTCLIGRPVMAPDKLWHLWHPPQDKSSTPERRLNQHLRSQYSRARRDKERMTQLVFEARGALGW